MEIELESNWQQETSSPSFCMIPFQFVCVVIDNMIRNDKTVHTVTLPPSPSSDLTRGKPRGNRRGDTSDLYPVVSLAPGMNPLNIKCPCSHFI
jgi:hypothetical protein